MTKAASWGQLADHPNLRGMLTGLVSKRRYADAMYLNGILKSDLVETGHEEADPTWPQPGDVSPLRWHIYEAALRWCKKVA
jgi:hypothetical protein